MKELKAAAFKKCDPLVKGDFPPLNSFALSSSAVE